MTFFEDLGNENVSGVTYKNNTIKKEIISILSATGRITISDLSKELNLAYQKLLTY